MTRTPKSSGVGPSSASRLLGRLVVLVVYVPLCMLAWSLTGGPNGEHVGSWWVVAGVFGIVAILITNRLPPPWNGSSRDEPTAEEVRAYKAEAERQLSERGSQLSAERAGHVRLLIDSGFEQEALRLLASETSRDAHDG